MSEATEFLGVVQRELLDNTHPVLLRSKDREEGHFWFYPVFTSREGAEAFVRAAGYPDAYETWPLVRRGLSCTHRASR
jgi:hypothetical protein